MAKFLNKLAEEVSSVRQDIHEYRGSVVGRSVREFYKHSSLIDGGALESAQEVITDTFNGLTTITTPWRARITRDRLAHALYYEQKDPLTEGINKAFNDVSNGLKKIASMGKKQTKENRSERQTKEKERTVEGISPFTDRNDIFIAGTLMGSIITEGDHIESAMYDYNSNVARKESHNAYMYILNTSSKSEVGYEYIPIQNTPSTFEVKPETSWATLKSLGRNTPFYQYIGSEDTISFEISWYCNNSFNFMEVLHKCRLLESWSKSDGYGASPPILNIVLGEGDTKLTQMFQGFDFILTDASYTLNNLQSLEGLMSYLTAERTDPRDKVPKLRKPIHTRFLYPSTAVQKLTFKRVSTRNITWEDIISSDAKGSITKYKYKI